MTTLDVARLLATIALPDRDTWTRDPDPALGDPAIVVVVPPDGDAERGARIAGDLSSRARVRLVARGATQRDASPAVVLTELDAYLPADKTPILEALHAPVEAWITDTFGGALGDVPVLPSLWGSAMMRVLRAHVHAAPLALGLAAGERGRELVLSEPWIGEPMLALCASHTSITLRRSGQGPALPYAVSLGARSLASGVAAPLRRALEFVRQTPARDALRAARARLAGDVDAWITVTAHWPHSCRHVIEPLGRAARSRGLRLGLLFQYAIEPGELGGGRRELADRGAMFPALSHEALDGVVGAVDQIASAESWRELAAVARGAGAASARVVARLIRAGAHPSPGGWPIDLAGSAGPLAQLATIDLLRALEARSATERLLARRDVRGVTVAFSHASLAQVAVPDQLLQRAGARTVDVVHGALAEALDMTTSARTWSALKIFWTDEEVRYTAPLLRPQACVGGAPSRTLPARARGDHGGPPRILLLTNYATRTGDRLRQLPRIQYQHAFFDAIAGLRSIAEGAQIRWRPHPGDDPDAIAAALRARAALGLERSTSRTVDEDLEWADVVVSSISSTIVEASVHPVAILVHAIPVHERDVILAMFDPGRLFRDRASFERAIEVALCDRERAAEGELRRRFFGAGGRPRALASIVLGDSLAEARHRGAS